MTGGTLPAQTWHDIMAYAHEGIETKPPFGVAPAAPAPAGQIVAATVVKGGAAIVEAPRQIGLSPHSARIILEIGDIARSAQKHAAAEVGPQVSVVRAGALAQ